MPDCVVIDMRITTALLVFAGLILLGCQQPATRSENHTESHEGHDAGEQHGDHAAHKPSWTLEVASGESSGQRTPLKLSFKDESGQPQSDFEVKHEKPLHLIAVSENLGWYQHVHPTSNSDKAWEVDLVDAPSGKIVLFADFKPANSGDQVLRTEISLSRPSSIDAPRWEDRKTVATVGGVKATLGLEGGTFSLAKPQPLEFQISSDERKPIKLEPYLGAYGHLVIIDQKGQEYVHSHPASGSPDGKVTFEAHFPKAGLYRAWAEFQVDGKVHTFPFVIEATP